jgi:hypothetical protein
MGLGQLNPFGDDFLGTGYGLGSLGGSMQRGSDFKQIDPNGDIDRQAYASGQFAGMGEGGYGQMTREMARDRDYLRGQVRGQNSVSAEQLRQALAQQQGQQMSMAAGARPGSAPMAARTAMMNMSRQGSAMAGNQAMAGIAERNAAAQNLAQINQAQRGQDINVALGARQNALGGYQALENARTQRYMADMGVPSTGERLLGAGAGIAGMALMSDRRLKKNIRSGDDAAARLLKALRATAYDYKDEHDGKGSQLGIIAQDLERGGLTSAVIDTPRGKAVHGGKLAAALAATLPGIDKRIAKLEGKAK